MFEYMLNHKESEAKGLTEPAVRHFFQQLMTGLGFAHELGIANRCVQLPASSSVPSADLLLGLPFHVA